MVDIDKEVDYKLILAGLKEVKEMCNSYTKCTSCPLYNNDSDECFLDTQPSAWNLQKEIVTHVQHHIFKESEN